jgi:hypothetical protein
MHAPDVQKDQAVKLCSTLMVHEFNYQGITSQMAVTTLSWTAY